MIRTLFATTALALVISAPAYAITGPFNGTFKATKLVLDDLAGRAEITVGGTEISVGATGDAEELASVTMTVENGTLRIRSTRHNRPDWNNGLANLATYKINVPKGTSLAIDDMKGEIQAGDIGGELDVDAGALKGSIGAVKSAHLDASGALKLDIGEIAGELALDASGAARIKTGNVDSVHLDISGAGDVDVAAIRHGLDADINGASHVRAASVNGPVNVEVSGMGEVTIAAGRADPLKVDISGMGRFEFGGEAVNPDISASGRGSVKLRSYSGKLHTEGANITIGD